MRRILVTGLAGFIGHHLGEAILKETDAELVGLDRLDATSTLHRLTDIGCWGTHKHRVSLVWHDLKSPVNDYVRQRLGRVDTILHLAASTHVDRSITDPMSFVMDNVVGTANLLDYARSLDGLDRLVYFSTDEVFGPAPEGVAYHEWARYHSANPYAASKAGAEELCIAYENTYKLPLFVTHCMNVFGERQHPEKFIPMTIKRVRDGERVTIHADKTCTKAGSRFYIHARNVAAAVLFLLHERVESGSKFNIVGEREIDNLAMAKAIANIVGKALDYEMVDFHSSRPGHDLRYALDGRVLYDLGFRLPKSFEESLERTVRWFLAHPEWLL
jgi:dTDP-glucose 4,6-dehydratase